MTLRLAAKILTSLSGLALVGAWLSQFTGGSLLGMTQQHLFSDSMALSLLGIALIGLAATGRP